MRFLRVLGFALEGRLGARQIFTGEIIFDVIAYLLHGFFRQRYRVGTHIGNQTHCLAADVHAFIQRLRGAHGAVGGHAQFAHRFLLQGGSGERRGGITLLGFLLNAHHLGRQLRIIELGMDRIVFGLAGDAELLEFLALILE